MNGTLVVCQYCETTWNSEVLVCPKCNEYKGLVEYKGASCDSCGTTDKIVHSGTDAFFLGCLDKVERICYSCAEDQRSTL